MRRLGYLVAAPVLMATAALWMAPAEPDGVDAAFDAGLLSAGIGAYLEAEEAGVVNLRPGAEKQVIWAGAPEARTDWAVVYLHGFSAASQEIRPVPDRVAEALGANLYFTRLEGHGRDGAAMAEATLPGWMEDVAEALAVGRSIGDRVLVVATSTGATLATIAAHDPDMAEDLAGIAMVSPNYRVKNPAAMILTWPGVRYWGPVVAGETRRFEPMNDAHARHWTTEYPTVATLPMAESVQAARNMPHREARIPAFFIFSDLDQVVDAAVTREVASAWGGPVEIMEVDETKTEPFHHVIAGDILSPAMTDPVADRIVDWARTLPEGG